MNRRTAWFALATTVFLCSPSLVSAEYTLVLKNGRRITVQAYREEGQMIKFYGAGGEVGIPRDQIQSILKAAEGEGRGLDLRGAPAADTPEPDSEVRKPSARPAQQTATDVGPPGDETEQATERGANEAQDYRQKLEKITGQLKDAEDSYLSASRGSNSPEPSLLDNDEAMRRRTDDLSSRLKDAQRNPIPSDAGPLKLQIPSPFTGQPPITVELRPGEVYNSSGLPIHNAIPTQQPRVEPPPPPYSDREKELSNLRNRMNQLVIEREALIEEMKRKNLEPGNLSPE
jgi:hypothetical protein